MIIKQLLTRNIQCEGSEVINIFNIDNPGVAIYGGITSWNFINGTFIRTIPIDKIEEVKLKKNEILYENDVFNQIVINTFGDMKVIDFHISLDSEPVHINILIKDNISSYKRDEMYSVTKQDLKNI